MTRIIPSTGPSTFPVLRDTVTTWLMLPVQTLTQAINPCPSKPTILARMFVYGGMAKAYAYCSGTHRIDDDCSSLNLKLALLLLPARRAYKTQQVDPAPSYSPHSAQPGLQARSAGPSGHYPYPEASAPRTNQPGHQAKRCKPRKLITHPP
jgi:hypothetical protein